MDKLKAISYLESSFLASLLKDTDITDISYNGKDIYYVSNNEGRKKSDIVVEYQTVKDFLRQIANICEKQFSFITPNLDVSFGKYRMNATHQSIGRIGDEGVVTFALRMASQYLRVSRDSGFMPSPLVELIVFIIQKRYSIVIGGITGVGKTEFQKFLLSILPPNERVIVIDNVMELDMVRNDNIDLTCWQANEENKATSSAVLIKNALRNNPDWLIVAESRGEEMINVLDSAMTGLPIITTLHCFDVNSMPYRMGRMILRNSNKLDYDETLKDIYYHFHFYFHLEKKEVDGHIERFISAVNYVDNDGNILCIYHKENDKHIYTKFSGQILSDLKGFESNEILLKTFGRKN